MKISHEKFRKDYDNLMNSLRDVSISKNKDYGSSFLKINFCFSTSKDPKDGLATRIDDKLCRIYNILRSEKINVDEDITETVGDLINYLAYYILVEKWKKEGLSVTDGDIEEFETLEKEEEIQKEKNNDIKEFFWNDYTDYGWK